MKILAVAASILVLAVSIDGYAHHTGKKHSHDAAASPASKETKSRPAALAASKDVVRTRSGLAYKDVKVGTGAEAKAGKTVVVDYAGWVDEGDRKGKMFDNSYDRGKAFTFNLGAGRVIKGWDEGVSGMKVGGKRTLMIPAKLGYGAKGAGSSIPPNSDLIFDVVLIDVK